MMEWSFRKLMAKIYDSAIRARLVVMYLVVKASSSTTLVVIRSVADDG